MTDYRFERNARRSRQKALYVTIFFHLLILGGLAFYSSGADWRAYVPEALKTSLGIEEPKAENVAVQGNLPRP
jgi:hypothetical protein